MSHDAPTPPTYRPAPEQPGAPTPTPTPAAPYAARPGSSRTWWIVGGAVAGVALLGGGLGIGALVADRDDMTYVQRSHGQQHAADQQRTTDQQPSTAQQPSTDQQAPVDQQSTTQQQPTDQQAAGAPATSTGIGGLRVDADDIELGGDVLQSVTRAALEAAGGEGVVTAAERSDDPTHTYEVEVTRDNGTQMDIYLDASFGVVATQSWHLD